MSNPSPLPTGIKFTHKLKPTGTWNILTESWIPVRFRDGRIGTIPIRQIVNPEVVELDFVLQELEWTTLQFLIGLIQTTCLPRNKGEQARFWVHPPSEEDLQKHLDQVKAGFFLDGDVQFYQIRNLQTKKKIPLGDLMILRKTPNGAFYRKDYQSVTPINPGVIAMLLYLSTMYDPGTGGSSSGIRGQNFVTVLIEGQTLWQKVWRNVIPLSEIPGEPSPQLALEEVFEWLSDEIQQKSPAFWANHKCPESPVPIDWSKGIRPTQFLNFFRNYWMFTNVFCVEWGDLHNLSWDQTFYRQTRWVKRDRTEWLHPLSPYMISLAKKSKSNTSESEDIELSDFGDIESSDSVITCTPVQGFLPYQRYKEVAKYNYLNKNVRAALVLQKNLPLNGEMTCRVFGFGGIETGRRYTNSFDFTTVVKGNENHRLALYALSEQLVRVANKIEKAFQVFPKFPLGPTRKSFYARVDPLYDWFMDAYIREYLHPGTNPTELLSKYVRNWNQELVSIAKNLAHNQILSSIEPKSFWRNWGRFLSSLKDPDPSQPSKKNNKKTSK